MDLSWTEPPEEDHRGIHNDSLQVGSKGSMPAATPHILSVRLREPAAATEARQPVTQSVSGTCDV